jgi:uroporphyrinogen-III synthase
MSRPAPVWVVATLETARRWARGIQRTGTQATVLGWSEVVPVEDSSSIAAALRSRPDWVVLTSAAALRAIPAGLARGLEALCVGKATATAARRAGFEVAAVGRGGSATLPPLPSARRDRAARVLWLRGRNAREEWVADYEFGDAALEQVVAYETRPRRAFATEVLAAPAPSALLVGSPAAAVALAKVAGARLGALRSRPVVAPGEVTAKRLAGLGFTRVRTAARPDLRALLAALASPR